MGLFGYKTMKQKDYDAMRMELKGFYDQQTEASERYFRLIESQLKGMDLPSLSKFSREDIKKAYETIAPVMGVVNYIADNVGEVSRYLELQDVRTGEYVENHWLIDLLNKPNDRFTRRKFLTAWAINRLLFGDAEVLAPLSVGADRKIEEMYILSGHKVTFEKGGLQKPLRAVRYGTGSGAVEFEGNVFESFDYNLDDTTFYGTSKVAAAAIYLSVMDRAMSRQATTLQNGGPASIITPAASSSVVPIASQVDDMEKKANKPSNANKNITYKIPIDVHPLGDNPADLSILEAHKDAINALCFVFKLPVDLYLGQAKYENAKEAKKTIYEQIAIPMCNEFAEDLLHHAGLDDEFTLKVDTDRIEVLRESRGDVLDNLVKMHASLNELREANDYAPVEEEWADKPIMPIGVMFGNEGGALDIDEV